MFLVDCSHRVTKTLFGILVRRDEFCKPPVLFDGNQLQTSLQQDDNLGSYYLQNTETAFYIPTLDFYYWGTDTPLILRTSADLSAQVPIASVEIVDLMWHVEQKQEAQKREQERIEALRQQEAAAARAEAEALWERARQEQERREAEMQAKQRLASQIRTIIISGTLLLLIIFLWWLIATSVRRWDAAEAAKAHARAQAEADEAEVARIKEEEARKQREAQLAMAKELSWHVYPGREWVSRDCMPKGERIKVVIEWTITNWNSCTGNRFESDACYIWKQGATPDTFIRHNMLFFDGQVTPAQPFREFRYLHRYEYAYIGTGEELGISFGAPIIENQPLIYQEPDQGYAFGLLVSFETLSAEDHAAAFPMAPKTSVSSPVPARLVDTVRLLRFRYTDKRFAWRDDDRLLWRYAQDHRRDLLKQEQAIITAFDAFHKNHELIDFLGASDQTLYGRVDAVFRYRALELARQPRPPETVNERRARVAREIQESTYMVRSRIDMHTKQAILAFESSESLLDFRDTKLREIADRPDLSDDEKAERMTELRAIIGLRLEELRIGVDHDPSSQDSPESIITLGDV